MTDIVIALDGDWHSAHERRASCTDVRCITIDPGAYHDHLCKHCGRGIDLHGGEFYATVVPSPDGGWEPNPHCTANPAGHEPDPDVLTGPPRAKEAQ